MRGPVESLAAQLGGYVTRALLEENLRESRARYSTLFDHTPVAVWEQDLSAVKTVLDGLKERGVDDFHGYFSNNSDELQQCLRFTRILKVNRESAAIFKCTRAEKLQENLLGYFDQESRAVFAQVFAELGSGRLSSHAELPVVDIHGKRRHLLARLAVCPGHEGDLSRVLVSFLDITEQKRAAALLLQSNRKLQAMSECRQALLRHHEEQSLLAEICRIICEKAMHAMAWVALAETRGKLSVRVAASYGVKDDYLVRVGEILGQCHQQTFSAPLHQVLGQGGMVVVEDFEKYETTPEIRELALARGYRSSVYLPLKDEQGSVFGTLNIYSLQANTFASAELDLLLALASDLAYGIGFLRVRLAQQRNNQVNKARVHLIGYAQSHTLGELLEETLNTAELLTSSCIGFYHFVNALEETLALQAWSTRTKREFCTANATSRHYHIAAAGVWVDCYHSRQPVIHNDYNSLQHRKGMPHGHANVRCFLSVPVIRGEDVVAILAVGNKVTGYDDQDVEIVSLLADLAWEIAEKKREEIRREAVEAQLRQAQKMEAIGTLAGGIAHDFNNILGAIVGYSEMVRDDLPADSPSIGDIHQVLKASHRAKDLVKQILAFSRQVEDHKIPMQPTIIVKEAINLLRSSLPTTIAIKQDIDPESGMILADPTQIHQIVMNLATNAFHAMEVKGGTLTITLGKKILSREDLALEPDLQPGTYVQLSIRDTGEGVLPEIKERIFDPFFTTKEVGKGTGLGLSMVYTIVKSAGGSIVCNSRLGHGAEFRILLPNIQDHAVEEAASRETIPHGKGHILFIDDEEMLVDLGKAMLKRLGYHVTTRTNSFDALTTFQNQPGIFDLVITDQTMPGMTGLDLARRILQIRPSMPIILCTGFSSQISEEKVQVAGIKGFAYKPLAKKDIGELIRRVLDGTNSWSAPSQYS